MSTSDKRLRNDLLVQVVREPAAIRSLDLVDWDVLVRQARRADMLARLWYLFEENCVLDQVPDQVLAHLESAHLLALGHIRAVQWEVNRIKMALMGTGVPLILLKGAAYVMAELSTAKGRLFFDVDILVPKSRLEPVERALLRNGWVSGNLDAYDQRYYRQWMHELPPLKHIHRKTTLDVHHTILPETAKLHPDADKLIDAAVPVEGHHDLKTLAPADLLLHSATHLFHEGELEHGFRDLVDLDSLFYFYGKEENFWSVLTDRAYEMDLSRPLYYGMHYSNLLLGTPIPDQAKKRIDKGKPRGIASFFMDVMFLRALMPDHPSCDRWGTGFARWCLYIRAHYLRMPLYLLIPHLVRKAVRSGNQQ